MGRIQGRRAAPRLHEPRGELTVPREGRRSLEYSTRKKGGGVNLLYLRVCQVSCIPAKRRKEIDG